MLKRDDELRLSDAVQKRYARGGDDFDAKSADTPKTMQERMGYARTCAEEMGLLDKEEHSSDEGTGTSGTAGTAGTDDDDDDSNAGTNITQPRALTRSNAHPEYQRMPVFVDGMDDAFNTALGCWPTSHYVISPDMRLLYTSARDDTMNENAQRMSGHYSSPPPSDDDYDNAGPQIDEMFDFLKSGKWK